MEDLFSKFIPRQVVTEGFLRNW